MGIMEVINRYVDLELECGNLYSSYNSAMNGLNYALGKGPNFATSIQHAQERVDSVKPLFESKAEEHKKAKMDYLGMAEFMSPQGLFEVLKQVGGLASRNSSLKSKAYGIVYNDLYSIYQNKTVGPRRR